MRTTLLLLLSIVILGCNNLSPRQDLKQEIDNQGGKIGEVENMTNSMKNEIGKLQNQAEIQNSRLEKIQQGLANIQNINENSGVQILSGNGGLMLAAGLLAVIVILITSTIHYRLEYKKYEKTAQILTQQIVASDNPEIEEEVFRAVMYTNIEDRTLLLFKKCKEFKDPC